MTTPHAAPTLARPSTPRARTSRRDATCVHCVVTRAVAFAGRDGARPVTLSSLSTHPPLVAMSGRHLYLLVHDFLRDAVERSPAGSPLRVRIVDDAHAEIHVLVATGAGRGARVRALRVPRHVDGILARGFAEASGGH